MKTFKIGGIHPPENKTTGDSPVVDMPVPGELRIMLSQCIGVPAKPIVKPGDKVEYGQMIAEAPAFVSAPVYSPVNGTVKKLEPTRTPQGIWQDSIVIETDMDNPVSWPAPRTQEEVNDLSPDEIIDLVGNSGIVGLGGATFPTKVKLSVPKGKSVEYVLINGAECEPCLTCDDALMRYDAHNIVKGTLLIMKATGAKSGIIGIEENKPDAIKAMKAAVSGERSLNVVTLKKKYPQGGEKQLIYALTGRTVPAGALPIETGCIVDNVATAYAIYDAIYNRRPLTERIVTVTGPEISEPGNFRVKNGTSIKDILDFAGGVPEDTGKIIAGGPMMGKAVSTLETPATKGLSGLVALPLSESLRKKEGPCIRCARCVSVCPMGLEPYLLMLQADVKKWDDMAASGVMNCLECGCCTYTCPSYRPLLDMIKLGKQELRKK
ncbi:MAG: electron transport complex subunit RsxC [Muribaculaceae bacterium]|nr:electron transport complex subunit RsxC [Muribaculaceae bacterium]